MDEDELALAPPVETVPLGEDLLPPAPPALLDFAVVGFCVPDDDCRRGALGLSPAEPSSFLMLLLLLLLDAGGRERELAEDDWARALLGLRPCCSLEEVDDLACCLSAPSAVGFLGPD